MSILKTRKTKIYPWIKASITEDDTDDSPLQLSADESPIVQNWLGDLVITYVADMGDNFQMVLHSDLPKKTSITDLHELAIDNLGRDVEFTLHETGFGGHGLIAGGDYEASSICLPGIWEWLAEHLGDHLIVGIPSKDMVVMIPESDTEKVTGLKALVQEIFDTGDRVLTKNIFRYDKDTKEWTILF